MGRHTIKITHNVVIILLVNRSAGATYKLFRTQSTEVGVVRTVNYYPSHFKIVYLCIFSNIIRKLAVFFLHTQLARVMRTNVKQGPILLDYSVKQTFSDIEYTGVRGNLRSSLKDVVGSSNQPKTSEL